MCSEPLTYEQIWGEPGEDQLLEEILVDGGDDDLMCNDRFEDQGVCGDCGLPYEECEC